MGHKDQRAVGASFHLLGISTSMVEKDSCLPGCSGTLQEMQLPFSHRLHSSWFRSIPIIPSRPCFYDVPWVRQRCGRRRPLWTRFLKILLTRSSLERLKWFHSGVDPAVCKNIAPSSACHVGEITIYSKGGRPENTSLIFAGEWKF